MARRQKLKVFRTPVGFHDAYVAAPSRKAALQAWGSNADLFARGVAEEVVDETLMREPLERPGEVVKRLRGMAEEQFAALPPDAPKRRKPAAADAGKKVVVLPRRTSSGAKRRGDAPRSKPRLRPSRDQLDKAERSLKDLRKSDAEKMAALAARELEDRQKQVRNAAEQELERLREQHAEALRRWREEPD